MFNFLFFKKYNGKVSFEDSKDLEPQEIFLDKLSEKKEEEMGLSERKMETPLPKWILQVFSFFLFLMVFLLLGRSFQMQIIDGGTYQSMASRNRAIIQPARVLRGVIYDKKGNQLVYNNVTFDLLIDKDKLEESVDKQISKLSDLLKIEKDILIEKVENSTETKFKLLADIDHEAAIIIRVKEDQFPGFSVERTIERKYENGSHLAHILGYTGEVTREEIRNNPERYVLHDHIGKAGLERFYEEDLARERGSFKIETDAHGNLLSKKEISPVNPGNNLNLWIDYDLQNKIIEVTEQVLEDIGSSKASVVAMNPQNGAILAMVNIPSYDNNVFSRTGDKDLLREFLVDQDGVFLNRAIEGGYSVGSTIKPLLAAAALEEGIISPEKKIYSPGYMDIPNPWDPTNPTRMQDYQAHGWTNMQEALAVSSNVYFYTIGGGHDGQEGLGISRMKEYLNLFGWGEKTGIDLPNEIAGRVPDPAWKSESVNTPWTLGDTYNTAIGQGYISITPLQVTNAYAALVNGGKLFTPGLVKSITDNGEVVKRPEPEIIRENFISEENLKVVKEGMKKTTTQGTARRLSWLPVDSGAKTGTAQIPRQGHYHNWISAFAPYEEPEIVLTVLVEEVEGIRASASAIAYDVLNWYFGENN